MTQDGRGQDSRVQDDRGQDDRGQDDRGQVVPARDSTTARSRALARWRRWRWPLLVAGAVVLVALLMALLAPRTTQGDLDPRSATPEGSRAVTEILRRQGVDVSLVTRSGAVRAQATADTTVVVVHPELLGPAQLSQLPSGADVVLVEPDAVVLRALAGFAQVAGTVPARVGTPACTDPDAVASGPVRTGGQLYRVVDPGLSVAGCYPQPGEDQVVGLIRTTTGGRTVTVLGQADVLRNGHLAEQGNAALALRLLGHRSTLVWYLPDPLELSDAQEPPTLLELVPRWVRWVVLELIVALVVAIVWRARRLGPLVAEPLPIVVRAAEAQQGRARLYRQAGARGLAAATLRTSAARRLAARLDVPPDAAPDTVALLAAQVTGRDPGQVRTLLLGPAPTDDAALVRLADQLDVLERGVAAVRVAGSAAAPASGQQSGPPSTRESTPAAGDRPPGTDPSDREAPHR